MQDNECDDNLQGDGGTEELYGNDAGVGADKFICGVLY